MTDAPRRATAGRAPPAPLVRLLAVASCFAALSFAIFACAGAPPRSAVEPPPPRPRLPAGADTNSGRAYYQIGLQLLERNLDSAADAFYWATRLEPDQGDALYARRVALHARNLDVVRHYVQSRRYDRVVFGIDSLLYEATLRDPFVFRRFESQLGQLLRVKLAPRTWGAFWDPTLAARRSYEAGDFLTAARLFGDAAARDSTAFFLHGERARAFYLAAAYDSALVEMDRMLADWRKWEGNVTLPMYLSKALAEFSVGRIQVARRDVKAAREAYARALVEDLSFPMAHADLAEVLLADGDTSTALQEYETAVQLRQNDPVFHYRYGGLLLRRGRNTDAVREFEAAIGSEPLFALPYLPLAYMEEQSGGDSAAVQRYDAFLQRASRDLSILIDFAKAHRDSARQRLMGSRSP
jgi:tetratricopeptide (TPR) repeat protein